MIVGIGADIVAITRIQKVLERSGESFARRILTEHEFTVFQDRKNAVAYLATRFSAKEAAAKALGTGIGKVSFQDLEVRRLKTGAPQLVFYGEALRLQRELGITRLHISLSDEREYAQAFVILEG